MSDTNDNLPVIINMYQEETTVYNIYVYVCVCVCCSNVILGKDIQLKFSRTGKNL